MHTLDVGGGDIFPDEISLDRELTMTAVDQHSQLDAFRPAEIIKGIHGRADSAPAKEHVIDEHDGFAGDIKRDDGGKNIRRGALIEVIPVHAHIERAGGYRVRPDAGEEEAQTLREGDPTAEDSYQCDFAAGFISFGNFVRDAGEGTIES